MSTSKGTLHPAATPFEQQMLAEVRALRAHLHRPAVRHLWLRHFVKGLETDPEVQAKVHKWACVYWAANFPIVALLFFGFPHVWIAVGLLVNTFYSLYANLATDYDGLSSSQASAHAREATAAAAGVAAPPTGVTD